MTGVVPLSLDVSAVPAHPVGAGRYTMHLAAELARREDVVLDLWCRRGDSVRWHETAPGSALHPVAPTHRPLRLGWEQVRLPHLLAATSATVHHAPHYTMPQRARLAQTVTIHDLTFFEHPEWHERSKVPIFRRAIVVASRRADALVCVSAHTADRLQERCAPRGRVFVIPHGVDLGRFGPDEPVPGSDRQILAHLGVHPPYVVFVGTLEPRKAVPDLVAAFDRIAGAHPEVSLVLAGGPGWGVSEVDRALGSARHADRVVRTGYVPDDAVPALLRRAAVTAYPSVEEGFGLPALEALATGTPLVTTAGTAMAEVTGDAAVLVTPGDVAQLADALDSELAGGPDAVERRRRGLAIAARYTWEACAARHVDAYRWAVDSYAGRAQGPTGGDR